MSTIKHIQLPDNTIVDLPSGSKITAVKLANNIDAGACTGYVSGKKYFTPDNWTVIYTEDGEVICDVIKREYNQKNYELCKVSNYNINPGQSGLFYVTRTTNSYQYLAGSSGPYAALGYFAYFGYVDKLYFKGSPNLYVMNSPDNQWAITNFSSGFLIKSYDDETVTTLPSTMAYGNVKFPATTAVFDGQYKKAPRILSMNYDSTTQKVTMKVLNFNSDCFVVVKALNSSGTLETKTINYTVQSDTDITKLLVFDTDGTYTTNIPYEIQIGNNNILEYCTFYGNTMAHFWT